MTSLYKDNGNYVLLSKGAPEIILDLCSHVQRGANIVPITHEIKNEVLEEIKKLQVKSMRSLGFAYKEVSVADEEAAITTEDNFVNVDMLEENLIFGGFV